MIALRRILNDPGLARAIIAMAVGAILIASLIEFRARREAAAIARELQALPAAPAQPPAGQTLAAGGSAIVLQPQAAVLDRTNADQDIEYLPGAFDGEDRPLAPGERCIRGHLFRQIPGGWEQIPKRKCNDPTS